LAAARKLLEEPAASAEPKAAPLDFAAVYDAWFRSVHRWVKLLGGPALDSEDVTQEVFVVVQRKLRDFDGGNLAGWLYRISERTVRDQRRRAWFRHLFWRERDVEWEQLEAKATSAEELLARKQQQQRFYRLVAQMNTKWRDSFLLFEIDGYSGEEIAALRGVPSATVRTHLHRARKEFLQLVAKEKAHESP
jgi:RNA polymerase sigma-70 factor (ECF subfamily)